jgi:glucose-6-phosphate isomerase
MSRVSWQQYCDSLHVYPALGVSLDLSRAMLPPDLLARHAPAIARAFEAMRALEAGAIANPDEQRMVGHYWLRDSARAPTPEIRAAIDRAREDVLRFAGEVHAGTVRPERRARFENVLVVGIGGSALGPQFVAQALGRGPREDRARVFFLDNTDPDGFDRTFAVIEGAGGFEATLCVVISKSGSTRETRNGMLETKGAYGRAGLSFARHAVAVTGEGSELDRAAKSEGWLATFPMWDWVGGRTSELSAVGLLPAALQGLDADGLLRGAREMDEVTRTPDAGHNPAMLLALTWLHATEGRGAKDMVILPYKDRLELFSRYLQQLVMESLGKEKDLAGNVVHQGITVYGNKGSTDQHAYVQQLREGVHNFFVTFVEVLRDREGASMEVEPGVTSGDYLFGFLEGTRAALYEKGRASLTLTLERVDARAVGMLVALYERAVGFYASLVGINAYHQPGVEAGKKAAAAVLALQERVRAVLASGGAMTAEEAARAVGSDDVETVWKILRHLAANPDRGVVREGDDPASTRFRVAR